MALISYDPPERFVTGTVGPPGQRQFFLQASGGGRVTSVACEKLQVQILAERLEGILDSFAPDDADERAAAAHVDNAPLDTPIEQDFTVGTMGLAWDPATGRIVIECHAAGDAYDSEDVLEAVEATGLETDPADDPTQLVLRVSLSPAAARAFVVRSEKVVAAGRPACPFCANPLDPAGHVCPRANGYRRR